MSTEHTTHQQDEGAVLLEQRGPIAVLTLSHPAALNALTWAMYRQMEGHLERLATDETTRVIILHGEGAEEAIDFDDVLARIYGSADFAEGVQAYLEKREPHWRGV